MNDDRGSVRDTLLLVLTLLAVLAVLKSAATVCLILAYAAFLGLLVWPVYRGLSVRLPGWLALVLTLLLVLLAGGMFFGSITVTLRLALAQGVAPGALVGRLAMLREQALIAPIEPATLEGWLAGLLEASLAAVLAAMSGAGLALALVVLGLPAVTEVSSRLREAFPNHQKQNTAQTFHEIAAALQRFVGLTFVTCGLNGILTGLFCGVIGLDLALVWGVAAFLLNFIAGIGSTLAMIPPMAMALSQFEGLGMPAVAFVGIGLIQAVMGSYVEPRIEARALDLQPVVVLAGVVFWGWMWGIGGALLATPITTAGAIVCAHFPQTRWLALLLTRPNAALPALNPPPAAEPQR